MGRSGDPRRRHPTRPTAIPLARIAASLAAAASLLCTASAATAQNSVPLDRVTGQAIPVLPGQFHTRMPSGCWMITDEPFANWANYYQFVGACTFGVINGPGMIVDRKTASVEDREPVVWAELGELTPDPFSGSRLYAARTSSHDLLETMSLKRAIDPTNELFERRGSVEGERLVNHTAYHHGRQTDQELYVQRAPCPAYSGMTNEARLQESIASSWHLTGKALSAATDFCRGEMAKLRKAYGESVEDFKNVDFGFYYLVRLKTSVVRWEPDGDATSEGETYDARLCPDLTSLTGCEVVWQQMLAPFIAKFDQLKPQEAALLAQHRAERRQRFAPLARAWRNRILEATGGASPQGN